MRKLAVLLVFCLLLAGCQPEPEQKPTPTPETPTYTAGYRAVTGWDMGFLAVGTDGRVDLIAADGTVTRLDNSLPVHLNDVTVYQNVPVMVGDDGLMLGYVHGELASYTTGTLPYDLYATTVFRDMWLVGGSDGVLMVFQAGRWEDVALPTLTGDIVGLTASDDRVLGVTNTGMAFASEDGHSFTVWDINADRAAEKALSFTDVTNLGPTFWATATCADGSAAVLTSVFGGVWTERPLDYMDGAPFDPAGLTVAGLAAAGEQMIVACNEGRLLTLPDCLQCNKLQTVGEGVFTDVSYHGGKLAAVGENFTVTVTDAEAVAQYKISAETAKRYMDEGAVLIDVRDKADYAARHIAGSLHIPLAELAEQLPALVPDKETTVIFYCTLGMRSQTAVEQALELEYIRAFTLGAIDAWPYDFE